MSASLAAHAEFLLPLAWTLIGLGLVVIAIAALLIAFALRHRQPAAERGVVAPAVVGTDVTGAAVSAGVTPAALMMSSGTPVVMTAHLDPALSRGMWLIKWFLAIPHFLVLGFLWAAFGVITVIAFAILFTGEYPRSLFNFNVGVLRWTWRVSYYCGPGGIGTDRYPPFSLDPLPDDLATLDVAYPGPLSRGRIFVKWFLAIPHLIITCLLVGNGSARVERLGPACLDTQWGGFGLLGLLVLVAGIILLFSGEYPKGLFDLIIGLNRWVYRVAAYVSLMTDKYPPFRLDGGETERPAAPKDRRRRARPRRRRRAPLPRCPRTCGPGVGPPLRRSREQVGPPVQAWGTMLFALNRGPRTA